MTMTPIYTLHEAAEKLRMKPRSVAKIARRHGLCSINGRDLLFSEEDIKKLWETMRCEPASIFRSSSQVGHAAMQAASRIMRERDEARSRKRLERRSKASG